jgi:two-component system, cell cycle sensor histidine kinase and response regulator CckA
MSQPLRVLIVEDSQDDTLLIVRELRKSGWEPTYQRVETAASMTSAIESQPWDLVISDYSMPQFGGAAALALFKQKGLDIPFISVSGAIGEDLAVEMMKAGAHDYVMKNNLTRLAMAVTRELRAADERRETLRLEAARAHLASIVEHCEDAIVGQSLDGMVTSWNKGAERLYGYSGEEMISKSASVLVPSFRPRDWEETLELIKRGERVDCLETVQLRKDGQQTDVSLTISPIRNVAGVVIGASTVARDISQRKREEAERLKLIQELTDALAQVKTLTGLLPICAACKKIRDDNGYWQQVETYIQKHANVDFTHGICPECVRKLYPEYCDHLKDSSAPTRPQA